MRMQLGVCDRALFLPDPVYYLLQLGLEAPRRNKRGLTLRCGRLVSGEGHATCASRRAWNSFVQSELAGSLAGRAEAPKVHSVCFRCSDPELVPQSSSMLGLGHRLDRNAKVFTSFYGRVEDAMYRCGNFSVVLEEKFGQTKRKGQPGILEDSVKTACEQLSNPHCSRTAIFLKLIVREIY